MEEENIIPVAQESAESKVVDDQPKQDDSKKNLRNLSRKNEALERQNQELARSMQEMRSMIENMQRPQASQAPTSPYDRYGIQKGELVESDKLLSILERERADMESMIERKATEMAEKAIENKRKSSYMERLIDKYPDYNDVVNEDFYEAIDANDRTFVKSLEHIQDPFVRRELAYEKAKSMSKKTTNYSEPMGQSTAQKIVDGNKKANYAYSGSGTSPASTAATGPQINWQEFHTPNSGTKSKAYEELKKRQGNMY